MKSAQEIIRIETDVLVIGGGLAGCMAAIKASESNVSVTIAEKSHTKASGCAGTGIDHIWAYIPSLHKMMGYSMEDLIESHTKATAQGFIDSEIIHLIARESFNRMLDLESFGLNFRFDDSNLPGNFRVVAQFHSVPTVFNFEGRDIKTKLTAEAKKRGVNIVNRVSMIELLTSSDGHISGALGVGTRDGKLYHFKAKAVVLSTGRVNRMTKAFTGVWGNTRLPANETGDGRAMAFRAGLPIINMEFLSSQSYSIGNFELNLGSPRNTTQPAGSVVEGDGTVIVPRTQFYDFEKLKTEPLNVQKALQEQMDRGPKEHPRYSELVNQGRGPFYLDLTGGTPEEIKYIEWSISHEGKGNYFLGYLKNQENFDFARDKLEWFPNSREMAGTASSGLVVNKNLETETKGLFAAGDEVGGVPWAAAGGAVAMGWHAGKMAAKESLAQNSFPSVTENKVKELNELCDKISNNEAGLHWREVEMAIQNIVELYTGNVKSENMLSRGGDRLREIKDNISFRAENPHELNRCLEVMSILENAEMVFRAALQRKESRLRPFGFYRADYPEANNENFFTFLGQRLKEKKVEFSKIKIN